MTQRDDRSSLDLVSRFFLRDHCGRPFGVKYVPAIKAHLFDQLGRSTYAERARLRALVLTASVVERELLPIRGREL